MSNKEIGCFKMVRWVKIFILLWPLKWIIFSQQIAIKSYALLFILIQNDQLLVYHFLTIIDKYLNNYNILLIFQLLGTFSYIGTFILCR